MTTRRGFFGMLAGLAALPFAGKGVADPISTTPIKVTKTAYRGLQAGQTIKVPFEWGTITPNEWREMGGRQVCIRIVSDPVWKDEIRKTYNIPDAYMKAILAKS